MALQEEITRLVFVMDRLLATLSLLLNLSLGVRRPWNTVSKVELFSVRKAEQNGFINRISKLPYDLHVQHLCKSQQSEYFVTGSKKAASCVFDQSQTTH